jgi:hypothetical protein
MVYEGTEALNYVKNYAQGTSQWDGFPIKVQRLVHLNFFLNLTISCLTIACVELLKS